MRATHMDTHIGDKTFEVRFGHHRIFNYCSANAITQNSNSYASLFQCKICNKKFKTRITYRMHMKRHTEGKNHKKHQCEHCDMRFISNHHMRLHQKNIHEQIRIDFHPEIDDNDDDNLNQIVNDVNLARFSDDDDDDIMDIFL